MRDALGTFLRWLQGLGGSNVRGLAAAAGSSVWVVEGVAPEVVESRRAMPARPRFHLAVDDGGELLVVCGRAVSIGHARPGVAAEERADVGLLADLDPVHAELRLEESFHGGAGWVLHARARVRIDGRGVDAEGRAPLADGARVEFGPKLSFVLHRPDAASASAVLELEHGAEAEGARRVLLLAPGAEGRARIGSGATRHIPVPDLEHDVTLLLEDRGVTLSCSGGVRPMAEEPPPELAPGVTLTLPIRRRVDLLVNARETAVPPFVVAFGPSTV